MLSSVKRPAHRSWQHLPGGYLLPEDNIQKDVHLRLLRLRRSTAARNSYSSGQHSLIGADILLRAAAFPPEDNIQKDVHLRLLRLRRSTAARNSYSSGQHSLIGADILLRAAAFPPEDNIQKDDHLRLLRLRRSTAARNSSSSGRHSLTGAQRKQAPVTPMRASSSELRGLRYLRLLRQPL